MNLIKQILKKIGLFEFSKKIYFKLYPKYLESTRFFRKNDSFCTTETVRCLENKNSVNYKYHILGKNTPVCCNTHLYEILRDVVSVLEEKKLTYFMTYGTFLGAIRHKGIIPWDTDVDLGVFRQDLDSIEKVIRDKLSSKYYINRDKESILRVYFSQRNSLHIDFEVWDDKGEYIEFNEDVYIEGGVRKMDRGIIFPLKKYPFYDLEVYGPNKTQFLNDVYGDDYMSVGYKKYGVNSKKIDINPNATAGKINKNILIND